MQAKKKDFSPIKSRVLQYLEIKEITLYRCYKDTGISKNILSQPNGLSEENLIRIIKTFQDINLNWLVLGEGSMLKDMNHEEEMHFKKTEIQQKLPEITPDYLLKRYEELVIENSELKKKLTETKKNVLSGLPPYPPITPATQEPTQLIKDKKQTDIQK